MEDNLDHHTNTQEDQPSVTQEETTLSSFSEQVNDTNDDTSLSETNQQVSSVAAVKIIIRGHKEETIVGATEVTREEVMIPSSYEDVNNDYSDRDSNNISSGDNQQRLRARNIESSSMNDDINQQDDTDSVQSSSSQMNPNDSNTVSPPPKESKFSQFLSNLHFILFGNRWISFLFGALLTFLSGTHYAYSSISPTIKNDLNFSQTQVNLIGTAANVGTYFALPVSMLNDFVGSRITCVISGILLFLGYFMFYLVYIKAFDMVGTDAYIFIACFMAVMGQGSAGAYAAAITTNIKNFEPKHRGKIIGFMGSCVALSSAVFSFIYSVGFERKLGDYLLFVGVFGGVITVIGTFFMNQIGLQPNNSQHQLSNGGYAQVSQDEEDVKSFVHDEDLEEDQEQINDFLMVASEQEKNETVPTTSEDSNVKKEETDTDKVKEENPIGKLEDTSDSDKEEDLEGFDLTQQLILEERGELMQEQVDEIEEIEDDLDKGPMEADKEIAGKFDKIWKIAKTPIPDANPLQMLFTLDFYLVFYVYFATIGSGLVIVNNLGSIVISFGGYDGQQHLMVMIFACSNALGRLLFGLMSDSLSRYITRTTFLTGGVLLMLICQLIVLVSSLWVYYFILILLGVSFGGVAVMVPSFLSERFGPKYFAVNSSICSLASSLGSFLLATLLAGKIYESNIPTDNMSKICYGTLCYQTTFYLTTTLCGFAAVGGIILMYRTRGLYQILYYRKVLNMNTDSVVTK